jgi:DNA modification methylase
MTDVIALHGRWTIHVGDVSEVIATLPDQSVQCVVTSPPYWGLRDYGTDGQLGLEPTPEEHVERMVGIFREVKRVLRDDGVLFLNYGDCYNGVGRGEKANGLQVAARATTQRSAFGLKPKDLVGMPWRIAFALQADGWYLRSDIIWSKCNPMPESVTDRPTKSHEYVFLLTKQPRYFYDSDAVREASSDPLRPPQTSYGSASRSHNGNQADQYADRQRVWNEATGRNLRSVWTIPTQPFPLAHFATFPEALVTPCVKAGSAKGDTVLDPFCGSGTVGVVACGLGRHFIGIELNPDYATMAERRIGRAMRPSTYRDKDEVGDAPLFVESEA